MDREFLTDEDIHGLEEDSELEKVKSCLREFKEKNEIYLDTINSIRDRLKAKIAVNNKFLTEETSPIINKMLELENRSYKELLELSEYEEV